MVQVIARPNTRLSPQQLREEKFVTTAASVIFITPSVKILLEQRGEPDITPPLAEAGKYTLPGGGGEEQDESIAETAAREAREEIRIGHRQFPVIEEKLILLGTYEILKPEKEGRHAVSIFVYPVEGKITAIRLKSDETEAQPPYKWVDLKELASGELKLPMAWNFQDILRDVYEDLEMFEENLHPRNLHCSLTACEHVQAADALLHALTKTR
jgi:8-oxo-dGTP pyrophosphatase MutT (NUDIX family)